MDIDLDELKRLAQAATPGEREWDGDPSNESAEYRDENAPWLVAKGDGHAIIHGDIVCSKEDAAFVCAANPAVILELIRMAREGM